MDFFFTIKKLLTKMMPNIIKTKKKLPKLEAL